MTKSRKSGTDKWVYLERKVVIASQKELRLEKALYGFQQTPEVL